jgi:hypothetical protein
MLIVCAFDCQQAKELNRPGIGHRCGTFQAKEKSLEGKRTTTQGKM